MLAQDSYRNDIFLSEASNVYNQHGNKVRTFWGGLILSFSYCIRLKGSVCTMSQNSTHTECLMQMHTHNNRNSVESKSSRFVASQCHLSFLFSFSASSYLERTMIVCICFVKVRRILVITPH